MKQTATKHRAEAILRELPSVIAVHVREDVYGRPREVHLLVAPGPDVRYFARDVRDLLEERLGVPVDQRVISIAQISASADAAALPDGIAAPGPHTAEEEPAHGRSGPARPGPYRSNGEAGPRPARPGDDGVSDAAGGVSPKSRDGQAPPPAADGAGIRPRDGGSAPAAVPPAEPEERRGRERGAAAAPGAVRDVIPPRAVPAPGGAVEGTAADGSGAPQPQPRTVLLGVDTEAQAHRVLVRVRLAFEGREYSGEAKELDAGTGRARAGARAALSAMAQVCGRGARFELEAVTLVAALDREYALVEALAVAPWLGREPAHLCAAHPVGAAPELPAVLAALKATDRVVARAVG